MKKTIITLLALAGVAAAADDYITTSYDSLLTSTTGWTAYKNGNAFENVSTYLSDNKFNGPSGWDNPSIVYTFNTPLTLPAGDTMSKLTFSYTFFVGADNAAATLSFVGDDKTIVTGSGWYNGMDGEYANATYGCTVGFGTTTKTLDDAYFYNFKDVNDSKKVTRADNYTMVYDYESGNKTLSVSGSITYSGEGYILSMSCGDSEAKTMNIGNSFNLNSIVLSGNGQGGSSISGLTISHTAYVPEPATATLSLLALAGLAARRRRR